MDKLKKAIETYIELKEQNGKTPTSREFLKVFSKSEFNKLFSGGNAFSKLQELAGDIPNVFSSEKSNFNEILINWGKLARKTLADHEKLPVQADWSINGLSPSIVGIQKSHSIKWSEIPYAFLDSFAENKEWEDVVLHISTTQTNDVADDVNIGKVGFVYLIQHGPKSRSEYKIGKTNNPIRREGEVKLTLPEKIQPIHYIKTDDPSGIEKYWHSRFADKRKEGEWFSLKTDDVLAFKRWRKIY